MPAHALRRTTTLSFGVVFLVAAIAALTVISGFATTAFAGAFSKGVYHASRQTGAHVAVGIYDWRLQGLSLSSTTSESYVKEASTQLNAGWARSSIAWSTLEPSQGQYDAAELARLDDIAQGFHNRGVKLLLTMYSVPKWASDSKYWTSPAAPSIPAGYQPYYPMKRSALTSYKDTAAFLADRYRGRVAAMEAWNEPNLFAYLYPQHTSKDPNFAACTYLTMLKAFSAGVRSAHADIDVVAGNTASMGTNDRYHSSPVVFARYLAAHGAASLFDAYSHHPYVPGGTRNSAPEGLPNDPGTTVTLGNLGMLTRIFPSKPFYLTEFGYNTKASIDFGWFKVSEKTQAQYVTRAYEQATRYPQVKVLIWFLVQDNKYGSSADQGDYTGLRRPDGSKKPSWYAFAKLGAAQQ
jgi:hypothetical protein